MSSLPGPSLRPGSSTKVSLAGSKQDPSSARPGAESAKVAPPANSSNAKTRTSLASTLSPSPVDHRSYGGPPGLANAGGSAGRADGGADEGDVGEQVVGRAGRLADDRRL